MEKNKEYIGEVLSLGSEGEGVINCNGTTVFVPFCLPQESVSFKVLKTTGSVAYGKLTEVHELSEKRAIAECPNFGKCGGCQLQHMDYELQLDFKRQHVESCLKKIGGISAEVSPCVASDKPYGYRNKLAVPVGVDSLGNTVIGFYAPRSHRIVETDDCALQTEWSQKLISALREFMIERGYKGYDEVKRRGEVRQLVARDVEGKLIITVVATKVIDMDSFAQKLEKEFKKFTLLLNINSSTGNVIFGKEWHICRGEGFFYGEALGIKFKAGANTFLQVNDYVREKLYKAVIAELRSRSAVAIDLYSGGGMLTALLAKECKQAFGIEIVEEAVACADELKELNGLSDKMFNICGKVEDKLSEVFAKTEGAERVIVCDPPRKGMERSVVRSILSSGADKVILISCDPATLARDLGLLCGSLKEVDGRIIKNPDYADASHAQDGLKGYYQIQSITPFDMFPQTKHVETLVVLSHKKPDSHIEVKIDFDNTSLDKSAIAERAEKRKPKDKPTYKDIQDWVEENYGFKVHTAYIAEVKRNEGLPMYDAPNAVEELKHPRPHPSQEMVKAIKQALKHFEII
ncbi:MAG: 23S rRNA (uracil(1939)-C(5))-methyltransferase RlmD [Candidatus Coproplasma sp.]